MLCMMCLIVDLYTITISMGRFLQNWEIAQCWRECKHGSLFSSTKYVLMFVTNDVCSFSYLSLQLEKCGFNFPFVFLFYYIFLFYWKEVWQLVFQIHHDCFQTSKEPGLSKAAKKMCIERKFMMPLRIVETISVPVRACSLQQIQFVDFRRLQESDKD